MQVLLAECRRRVDVIIDCTSEQHDRTNPSTKSFPLLVRQLFEICGLEGFWSQLGNYCCAHLPPCLRIPFQPLIDAFSQSDWWSS